jgi:hypothetical protein
VGIYKGTQAIYLLGIDKRNGLGGVEIEASPKLGNGVDVHWDKLSPRGAI